MNTKQVKYITIEEWAYAAEQVKTQTISRYCRPSLKQRAYFYTCTVDDFASDNTYLVRYTDEDITKIVDYSESNAKPIRIKDYIKIPKFVNRDIGNEDYSSADKNLITIHCIDCDRHIVVDGVHRIIWLALNNPDAQIEVNEISGLWSICTPDMNVVCECENRLQHDSCISPYRGRLSVCPS